MSHVHLREPQALLGNPQDATLSTQSCTGFRFKLAQRAPAQKFLNLIQTLTVCSWSQMIKRCCACKTPTQKEAWQRILQCLTPKSSHILIQIIKKPTALKIFPLTALFLLVKKKKAAEMWNLTIIRKCYAHSSFKLRVCSAEEQTQPFMQHCIETPAWLLFIRH